MCPLCLSTAALIAGSITSTAGLAAIAIRVFSTRNATEGHPNQAPAIQNNKEDSNG